MRLSHLPVMAAFLVASDLAVAETTAKKRSLVIEEVVVTARKQEESSQDVPIAITALTEELQNSSLRDLRDINGYAPNVIIGSDGSRGGSGASINIRGISPTRTDDNSFDAPIAVVIDEIYLGTLAGQVLENFDIERIEVLRGPQGTLFGKNTVGGVVNVVRTRPTGETGGRFKLTAGKDGQQELRAVFNTALSDQLALKLFGTGISYDGYMTNVTTGADVGDRDYQNIGATFLWEPNDRLDVLFTAEVFRDDGTLDAFQTNYNAAAGVLPSYPAGTIEADTSDFSGGFAACFIYGDCRDSRDTPTVSTNDTNNNFALDTDAFTLKMEYKLNDNLSLVSVTGYRTVDEYRIFDFDASSAPFITIERWNEYDQLSQEFRFVGDWDNVTLTAGLYYFNSDFTQDWVTGADFWQFIFTTFVPGASTASDPFWWDFCVNGGLGVLTCDPGIPSVADTDDVTQILFETQETTSYAAYAQMDWRFAERWTLTAGLRWTREEKDFVAGQAYLTNVARQLDRLFPGGYASLNKSWTETSPKIGVTYEINDDSILFASYAEGFKSGGFFGVNQNISDFVRDQYEPEFAKNWEVGYKSQHMGNRLRLNVTYFYNDFTDKQESLVALDPSTNTVTSVFRNAASATYSGLELETQYVFSEYFRAFLNYGQLNADYDEFILDIRPNDGVDLDEDASFLKPRNAPEYTYGLGGTVSIPVGTGTVELFAKYTKIAEVETAILNTELARVAPREDVSASLGYFADNWSVVAFGRNLTDHRFETIFPIPPLFAAGTVNRPRTFGLEATFQF